MPSGFQVDWFGSSLKNLDSIQAICLKPFSVLEGEICGSGCRASELKASEIM